VIQNSDDIKDIIVNNSLELKEVKELIKSNISRKSKKRREYDSK
jgi:hypothetical protein